MLGQTVTICVTVISFIQQSYETYKIPLHNEKAVNFKSIHFFRSHTNPLLDYAPLSLPFAEYDTA